MYQVLLLIIQQPKPQQEEALNPRKREKAKSHRNEINSSIYI